MFRPELVEADADDDEATEDMSVYRRKDDDVSNLSLNDAPRQENNISLYALLAYNASLFQLSTCIFGL